MSGGGAGASGYGMNDVVVLLVVGAMVVIALMAVFGPTIGEIAAQINAARGAAQISQPPVAAHADQRHGSEAEIARQCGERPDWVFFNAASGRTAFGCWTDIGKLGVYIIERGGEEVTAFLKNKMSRVEQLIQYMRNTGYELLP